MEFYVTQSLYGPNYGFTIYYRKGSGCNWCDLATYPTMEQASQVLEKFKFFYEHSHDPNLTVSLTPPEPPKPAKETVTKFWWLSGNASFLGEQPLVLTSSIREEILEALDFDYDFYNIDFLDNSGETWDKLMQMFRDHTELRHVKAYLHPLMVQNLQEKKEALENEIADIDRQLEDIYKSF